MPNLSPCVVTVTSDGQPLQDAIVSFYTTDPKFRWVPGATTDAAGKAVMVTHGQYFGAVDGDYTITVQKTERESFDTQNPPQTIKVYTLIDPKFADATTSPLKIKVAGKTNETVDVGKQIKEVLRTESPM